MRGLKSIVIATAVTVALVLPIAVWANDDPNSENGATVTYETVHEEDTVQWLYPLSNGQCSAVPNRFGEINPDTTDRVAQISTKVRANGSKQLDIFDVVTGTATGNGAIGGTYSWVYENHAIYDVPAGAGPAKVTVRVFDRFRLLGNGFTMDISFDWRWKFQVDSGSAFDPGLDFNGVAFPDDPVNPTNVLNFKAFSTKGEPLACDPI